LGKLPGHCFTINEADFKANAKVLARLRQFGWTYAVIDEGWYMGNPAGEKLEQRDYKLDAHGLLVPSHSRLAVPSSTRDPSRASPIPRVIRRMPFRKQAYER